MGLDSVEIVLEIEDAFGIEFTEDEAASIATVGSMCDLIIAKLLNTKKHIGDEQVVTQVSHILHDRFGIPLRDIHPDARFVEDLQLD